MSNLSLMAQQYMMMAKFAGQASLLFEIVFNVKEQMNANRQVAKVPFDCIFHCYNK
jgi:hypothetical protein